MSFIIPAFVGFHVFAFASASISCDSGSSECQQLEQADASLLLQSHAEVSGRTDGPSAPPSFAIEHDYEKNGSGALNLLEDTQRTRRNVVYIEALVLPILLLSLCVVAPLFWYFGLVAPIAKTPGELIFLFGLFSSVQTNLSLSLPLIDSLDFVHTLGASAAFSGFMVGAYRGGFLFGSLALWMAMKFYPDLWRQAKTIYGSVLFIQTICAVVVYVVSLSAGVFPQGLLQYALLAARVVQGLGGSIISSLTLILVGRLFSPLERPERMLMITFAWSLGSAIGPVLARSSNVLVHALDGDTVPAYQVTLWAGIFLPFSNLILVFDLPLKANITCVDQKEVDERNFVLNKRDRIVVVLGSLAAVAVRAFGVASLEAGVSYTLQITYGWSIASVGVATSAAFSSCFPLLAVYTRCKEWLTIDSWLRLLMFVSVLGALLLHPLLGFSPPMLLLSCMVAYPTFCMSGGLVLGIMQNTCLPTGSIWDTNTVSIVSNVLANVIARILAAPAANWALHGGGQGSLLAYWLEQMALGVVALFLIELVLLAHVKVS